MKQYVIEDDYLKLIIYTVINLVITILLMIVAALFCNEKTFIITFLAITGIWFSVKAMFKYGYRYIRKTPLCEFNKSEVIINTLPEDNRVMKYKDIKEAKILKDSKSVKIFFSGNKVKHPSGWNYVGVIYPFNRKEINNVENNVKHYLDLAKVKYTVIEK